MPNNHAAYLAGVIDSARDWIDDCAAGEVPEGISDSTIIVLVQRNFEGGWNAFIAADDSIEPDLIYNLIADKYGSQFTASSYV